MNIIKITLRNLASLQGEHIIDFQAEPLRTAGLFAITGDTGAGKSTLLDAICLALYGQAPRFEASQETVEKDQRDELARQDNAYALSPGDARGLLRRGESEGLAQLEFSLPVQGERYLAQWSVRIRKKGKGTYESPKQVLRRLSPRGQEWQGAEAKARVAELLGLSYEQFTRTVLLAQGGFASFLRAGKQEKSQLLEKLTGTEIYAKISRSIYALQAAATGEADKLEAAMKQALTGKLTEEALDELTTRIGRDEASQRTAQSELQRTESGLDWLDRLDQARKDLTACDGEVIRADKALAAARADEQQLRRYDDVGPARPLYEKIVNLRRHRDSLMEQEKLSEGAQQRAAARLEQASQEAQTAASRTGQARQELAERLPAIEKGKQIQSETRLRQTYEAEQRRSLQELSAAARQKTQQRQQRHDDLQRSEKLCEELGLRLQEMQAHRSMFEHIDQVIDKMGRLQQEQERCQSLRADLERVAREQQALREKCERYRTALQTHDDRLRTLREALAQREGATRGVDFAALQQHAAQAQSRWMALGHAQKLWQRLTDLYGESEQKHASILALESQTEVLETLVKNLTEQLERESQQHERLQKALTLSESKELRALREGLREGNPCPVCGAQHHPLHTEKEREDGSILRALRRDFEEAHDRLLQTRQSLGERREQLAARRTELQAALEAAQKLQSETQTAEQEWHEYEDLDTAMKDCSPSVNRQSRTQLILYLSDSMQTRAAQAGEELKTYNQHQAQINKLRAEADQVQALRTEQGELLSKASNSLSSLEARAESAGEGLTQATRTADSLETDLDTLVTLSAWHKEWEESPQRVRKEVSDLKNAWIETRSARDRATTEVTLKREALAQAGAALEQAQAAEREARRLVSAAQEQIALGGEELHRLLGDETPEACLARLSGRVEQLQALCQQAESERGKALEQASRAGAQLSTLRQQREHDTNALRDAQHELDLWMKTFQHDHSPVNMEELARLFAPERAWAALRERLGELKNTALLAHERQQQAQQALLLLQGDPLRPRSKESDEPETREALSARREALEASLAELAARLSADGTTLRRHEESLQAAAEKQPLLEEARKDQHYWQQLADFFGSADGKKFRSLAQCYTLAYLTLQANEWLRTLSPRYRLRCVTGSLTLEILDGDMFDEHRYAVSLSGGESFVVSLALALGLASLSSGSLSIGNLFIDEGFGNLDQHSLSLVMDALSRLESLQGRKVGIISHTEQIRQQIQPQIHLVKLPTGGRSQIEIR